MVQAEGSGTERRVRRWRSVAEKRRIVELSARPDEQGLSAGLGATMLDIGDDRVANLLSQWQQCLTTAFPCNADAGFLPVDGKRPSNITC